MRFFLIETKFNIQKKYFFERCVYEAVDAQEAISKDNKITLDLIDSMNKKNIQLTNKVLMVSDVKGELDKYTYSSEILND